MPIQSMTGYGRGESGDFTVEVRSSNHKNIDISLNIPYYLFSQETEIKKRVRQVFQRGRVEMLIPKKEMDTVQLKVNKPLAREYFRAFLALKDELLLDEEPGMELIASQRDIFMHEPPEIDSDGLYEAVSAALEDLALSREKEGENLVRDIRERIETVRGTVEDIDSQRGAFAQSARDTLREKLKEALSGVDIDESRLIQEAAFLVERTDITEELVRLRSHLDHLSDVLTSGGVVGKKLDFIIQELRREINTIGSKAQQYAIASRVVEVKHELEKIREQVQNLQ